MNINKIKNKSVIVSRQPTSCHMKNSPDEKSRLPRDISCLCNNEGVADTYSGNVGNRTRAYSGNAKNGAEAYSDNAESGEEADSGGNRGVFIQC